MTAHTKSSPWTQVYSTIFIWDVTLSTTWATLCLPATFRLGCLCTFFFLILTGVVCLSDSPLLEFVSLKEQNKEKGYFWVLDITLVNIHYSMWSADIIRERTVITRYDLELPLSTILLLAIIRLYILQLLLIRWFSHAYLQLLLT